MVTNALSKADRNERIDKALHGLVSQRGVTTAAIVDADGFVTHIRRDFEVDTDAPRSRSCTTPPPARRARCSRATPS
jgi:hypothetical protein